MSQIVELHAQNPQVRLIKQVVESLKRGALIAYPTDSCYALGCCIDNRAAVEKIRFIRGLTEKHPLTVLCKDIAQVSKYAFVDDQAFRVIRQNSPAAITFILKATKSTPKKALDKRRSIGVRIPSNPIAFDLVSALGEPLITTTLQIADMNYPLSFADEIDERLGGVLDIIISGEACGQKPTTLVDLSSSDITILRQGDYKLIF